MDLHYSQTFTVVPTINLLFESPMDLHYSQTVALRISVSQCLNPLWIYTTLKLAPSVDKIPCRLNPLWIYTTLKL